MFTTYRSKRFLLGPKHDGRPGRLYLHSVRIIHVIGWGSLCRCLGATVRTPPYVLVAIIWKFGMFRQPKFYNILLNTFATVSATVLIDQRRY